MPAFSNDYQNKVGLPPGTIIHVGTKHEFESRMSFITYNQQLFSEKAITSLDDCFPLQDHSAVNWLNIDGVHQTELIESLGKHLNIHSLVLADIVNTRHRPKMEDGPDYLFIVMRAIRCGRNAQRVKEEQVSIIIGDSYVLSFLEAEDGLFDPIRERIRSNIGRIRNSGPDYLAYALLDVIVDNYFVVLESRGESIEKLEDEILDDPGRSSLSRLHTLKRDMVVMRRSIWPLREILGSLERGESRHIKGSTLPYLRDVYDHVVQVMDNIETSRDILAGMMDIYLSSNSNRTNAVMKVLTLIATIFMPLTFIAGVYGMNFKFMPELEWHYGYMAAWGLMIGVGAAMALYFRRKDWM